MLNNKSAYNCLNIAKCEDTTIGLYLYIKYYCKIDKTSINPEKYMNMLLLHPEKDYNLCLDACHLISNSYPNNDNPLYWYNKMIEIYSDNTIDLKFVILEKLLTINPIPLEAREILNSLDVSIIILLYSTNAIIYKTTELCILIIILIDLFIII